MQSSGGMATVEAATQRPVNLLMSGPVAGLIGGSGPAGWRATRTSSRSTSAARPPTSASPRTVSCACAICSTRRSATTRRWCRWSTSTRSARAAARSPYVDEGGVFRVGPQSAGADPGPACYGRGGTEPTATDAQLLLGRLRPDRGLLGGDDAARRRARAGGDAEARRLARDVRRGGRARRAPDPEVRDGPGDRGQLGPARLRPARVHARRRGRRRPSLRLRASRSSSRSRACSCPRIRGSSRRPACWRRTSSTSSSLPSATRSRASTGERLRRPLRRAVGAGRRTARRGRRRRRTAACSGDSRTAATPGRATRFASTSRPGDRRGVGRGAQGGVPPRPRGRVRPPLRRRDRDRQHPRRRHRPDRRARAGERGGRRRRPFARAKTLEREVVFDVDGRPERRTTPFYDRAAAPRRRPDRRAGDHRAVRLDHGRSARSRRRDRPASATSSSTARRVSPRPRSAIPSWRRRS